MTSENTNNVNFPPAPRLHIQRADDGGLALNLDGQILHGITPRRMLPLSELERYIALYDSEGDEFGIIEDIGELPPDSQTVLREALAQAYVVRRITRILEVEKEPMTGQTRWRVEIANDHPDDGISHVEQSKSDGQSTASNGTSAHNENGASRDGAKEIPEVNLLDKASQFLGRARDTERTTGSANEREFHINGQEDVQTARFPHIYIVDTERNRYEIPDWESLDIDSRRAAEQFL